METKDGFSIQLYQDDEFSTVRVDKQFTLMEEIYFQISWSMPYAGLSYQVQKCGLFQNENKFNFIDQVRGHYDVVYLGLWVFF